MKKNSQYSGNIRWTARITSIAFALFISLFAMDVFSEIAGLWQTMSALLVHLVPTLIVVLILIISWRNEIIGGILYTTLGIVYVVFSWGKFDWTAYALIAGPLFLLGILYYISWRQNRQASTGAVIK